MFTKRAQSISLPNASLTVAVVFSSALPTANYSVAAQFVNALGTPIYQEIIISAKTPTGFMAEWPAPLDSGAYLLDYIAYVPDLGETTGDTTRRMGFPALVLNDVGKLITFSTPLPNANYAATVRMFNSTDIAPQFQSLVVTSKSAASLVVEWPAPVDSSNYRLEYLVTPWS